MKPRMMALAVLAAALSVAGSAPARAPKLHVDLGRDGFEKIATEHGVTVFKDARSPVITLGAVGRIPAPPAEVHKALLDFERQVGVLERLEEARVLERAEDHLVVYQRLSLPVIDDRDFTLSVVHGVHEGTHWINYWARNGGDVPERKGIVRVRRHRGVWELSPRDRGRATLARYEMSIDLAGDVPVWLAKSSAGEELPAVYGAICRLSLPPEQHHKCW